MGTRITIAKIEAIRIPHGKNEIKLWDNAVAGLCLRAFASGGRTWVFRYREGGGGKAPVKTYRIGSWPAVSIDAARATAKAHAALVAQGHSPAAVRHEQRRRERSTIGILVEPGGAYQRSLEARGIVKIKPVMAMLRRGLARHLHTDIAKLTRQDLVGCIDALDGLPGAQAELRKFARGLLEWATNTGLAPANVLAGLRLPPKTRAQRIEQAARRRALDDRSIVAVWKAADRHRQFGAIVQLCLLTAMRRSEAANLRWSDVRDDRIVVAAERAKTGAQHQIPLTPLMRVVIDRQPRTTSPLLFPSSMTGKALTGWKMLKHSIVPDAAVGRWTLHDCRRTTRTLMSRLGVREDIAELSIGHVRGGLIGIYDHDPKWSERVDAFAKVSAHIERLISQA